MKYAVVLSVLVAVAGMAVAEDPVVFGDPNLKAAVEEALGSGDLYDPIDDDLLDMLAGSK